MAGPDDFLTTYAPLANDIATQTGLDPAVVLGIVDTETGHGLHVLSNNIFGISPSGPGGQFVARYPDVQTGAQAFVSLMRTPRYAAVAADPDPAAQAAALVKSGYNTVNPNYASMVAGKALNFGKQLGYQDAAANTQAPPTSPVKQQVLSDPALAPTEGTTTAAPVQTPSQPQTQTSTQSAPASIKDQLLSDPALQVQPAKTEKPGMLDFSAWREPGEQGDMPPDPHLMASIAGAPSRIAGAVVQGYQNTPNIQTPWLRDTLNQSPLGHWVYNPLLDIAGTAVKAGVGLGAGIGQTAMEIGEAEDRPGLGRDINALLAVAPMAHIGTDMPTVPTAAPEVNPLRPRYMEEITAPPRPPGMTDAERITQLLRHGDTETAAGPVGGEPPPVAPGPPPSGGAGPSPGMGSPQPADVPSAPPLSAADQQWAAGMRDRVAEIAAENQEHGIPGDLSAAATPAQLAQLTPAQMKAYRAQAELKEIMAPPQPGMDTSIYVHGTEPTEAVYSGNPAISQKESLYRERDPDRYAARDQQNTQAVVNAYESMEGSRPELQDIRDRKAAAAERDGEAYIAVARPLDLTPALEWVDAKLADPRVMESPSRVKVLGEMRASLFDESGNLKTDPRSGWGMHDNMIDALDKSNDRTTAERYSQKLLTEYKKIIDGVNSTASDGAFQTFLDNQSEYARQINSMEQLQGFRPRFTNAKGNINVAAFHKFVADLAIRRARPGVDPAMGISDDTMHGLINIDKHLKRETNIDLGKSRGSQTNLFFTLAQATGLGAAHLGAAAISHGNPTANLFLQGAMNQAGRMTGNALLRRRVRRSLSPPPGGYDYNPLIPPSAPP